MDGVWDIADETDSPVLSGFRIGTGHGGQERAGIRVQRSFVDQLGRTDLDDISEIHDGNAIRVWKPLGNRIKLAQRVWLLGKPFKERYLERGKSPREKQSSFRSTEQLIPDRKSVV